MTARKTKITLMPKGSKQPSADAAGHACKAEADRRGERGRQRDVAMGLSWFNDLTSRQKLN